MGGHAKTEAKKKSVVVKHKQVKTVVEKPQIEEDDGQCVMCKFYKSWGYATGRYHKYGTEHCSLLSLSTGFSKGPIYSMEHFEKYGVGREENKLMVGKPICLCPALTCKIAGQCQVTGAGMERDDEGNCRSVDEH